MNISEMNNEEMNNEEMNNEVILPLCLCYDLLLLITHHYSVYQIAR